MKRSAKCFNYKNRLFNSIKKNKISITFLIMLVLFASIITYLRILVQIEIGPISDSFDFLSNALVYAGQGMGYSDLLRPPVFGFLISLIFRMGYISTNVVFYMDGFLFVLGVIGLYLLLKIRFNNIESFFGALLYTTFPIVITVLGVGFSDLASVSFTIWGFYFVVLAVNNNSKYFYLSFSLFMVAFLTRYNNALLIFPILLYLVINRDKLNFKRLFTGLGVSFLIIIPVLIFFFQKYGNMIYPFINFGSSSVISSTSAESFAYNSNVFFFIQNFPSLIGPQGIFIMIIIIFGVILLGLVKLMKRNLKHFNGINIDMNDRVNQIRLIILSLFLIIFLVTFGKIFYMITEILFFSMAFLLYGLLRNLNIKSFDIHLMFFGWFMAFFIFNSIYVIKDLRYFVLMAPPVAYFMILGLSEISNRVPIQFKNRNLIFPILTVILVSIILISTASQIPEILNSNNDKVKLNNEIIQSGQWFMNYDPNYKNQSIYSDLGPNYSWYLQTDVKSVPVFKDNQTFANGVKNETFNQADSEQFNNFLITNNADYYICLREGLNLTSYTVIKQMGEVTIYKKIT
ncbi:glycosyltransferase family 39 protein [Methanobacterium lacus]|uniref:glycosyltransferase family 39 protein n=1 Tax=Methanobacterium lacus (strain AL-21) TaxID=877455 RepID=UPI000ADB8BC1|nr:glycosyltransferase family 39 protein [Methanobacterium lacus]